MEGVDLPRDAVHAENLSLQRLKLYTSLTLARMMAQLAFLTLPARTALIWAHLNSIQLMVSLPYLAPQTPAMNTLA